MASWVASLATVSFRLILLKAPFDNGMDFVEGEALERAAAGELRAAPQFSAEILGGDFVAWRV